MTEMDWKGAEIINLGAGAPMPVGEVVSYMKKKLKSSSRLVPRTDPTAANFIIDTTRAREVFGWPAPDVTEILDRLV